MAWTYRYSKGALKTLKGLDKPVASLIIKFLDERICGEEDPRRLVEALEGSRLGEYWKLRVGDWRLICHIEDRELVVLVLQIGHRREVYKER